MDAGTELEKKRFTVRDVTINAVVALLWFNCRDPVCRWKKVVKRSAITATLNHLLFM